MVCCWRQPDIQFYYKCIVPQKYNTILYVSQILSWPEALWRLCCRAQKNKKHVTVKISDRIADMKETKKLFVIWWFWLGQRMQLETMLTPRALLHQIDQCWHELMNQKFMHSLKKLASTVNTNKSMPEYLQRLPLSMEWFLFRTKQMGILHSKRSSWHIFDSRI